MAAGEGPRDWQQDEAYQFPYASGGVNPARPRRALSPAVVGIGLVVAVIAVVAVVGALLRPPIPVSSPNGFDAPVAQPAPPRPSPVTYPSASAERSALLMSAQYIATTLYRMEKGGQAMPTSFTISVDNTVLAEPSGQPLGPLPYGNTIEWAANPDGQVTTLTLVGSTFQTRVPLDLAPIPLPAQPGSNA